MSKFIYICLLALVVDLVHCFTGQFYGFDGSPDSDYRYLRHRPRKCLKESCLTCDCYGSQCGRSRDQRILNYYYNGLFSNDRKSYIDRKIREFSINSNKTKLPRESTSFGPSEGPKYGNSVSLQPVQGFVGDDCCKTILTITQPIEDTVLHNGVLRTLVTVESSQLLPFQLQNDQYRVEGVCQSVQSPCGELNRGVCRQEYGVTEVLVHDDEDPTSFEFIPIFTRMYCRCSFPGELLSSSSFDSR